MKCFYHNADLDGWCSGAIVKYFNPECELIGIDYGDKFPWNELYYGETIFMVDFSLQPYSLMQELDSEIGLTLMWIDHHKSAIEEYNKNPLRLAITTLAEGTGACQLVWESLTDEKLPEGVRLLAEYDVWNHSDPRTLPYQWGMKLRAQKPDNQSFWRKIFKKFPTSILREGQTVFDFISQDNEKYVKACEFDTDLDGLHCVAVNKQFTSSQVFDTVWDPEKYHAMLTFGWRKGQWAVSLYSTREDVDVSVVAKNRGGGGHKGAAGFQCNTLPFELR